MQDTQEDLYVSLGWASQLASFLYSKLLAQAIGSRFPGLSHRCEIWKVDCFARKPVQETIYPLIIQHANGKSSTKSMSFPLEQHYALYIAIWWISQPAMFDYRRVHGPQALPSGITRAEEFESDGTISDSVKKRTKKVPLMLAQGFNSHIHPPELPKPIKWSVHVESTGFTMFYVLFIKTTVPL